MVVKSVAHALRYRWVILIVCWLAYIVAYMQRLSVGPLGPFLKQGLSLTSTEVGLFMSAAAFGYMLTATPAGWLVDRIGIRWLFLIGEVFGGIFIASMFTVTTFTQGLILMALAGMGMGCLPPSTAKAIFEWFPQNERATAIGFNQTAVNMGGIITASTLPLVATRFHWHWGFLGIGIIAILIGIVSFVLYKKPQQNVNLTVSSPVTNVTTKPSIRAILKTRDIWLLIAASMGMIVVEFAAIAYFVLYLKEVLLFAVVTAGFALAVVEAGGAFGKPISGLVSDRLFHRSRKNVYILMCGISFVMCMILAFLGRGTPPWLIVLIGLILGFAAIGWGGLHVTLIGEFAGRELAGTLIGMSSALMMVANIIGPPIFGYIVDNTGSYRIAWLFLAAMSVMAVIILPFVREERRKI